MTAAQTPLTLRSVTIVRPETGSCEGPCDIEVWGDRIQSVSPGQPPAKQLFVAPGLVNVHEHLTYRQLYGTWSEISKRPSVQHVEHAVRSARAVLAAGVTTVRDLGARDDLNLSLQPLVESDHIGGPVIAASGSPLSSPGGHAWEISHAVTDSESVRDAVKGRVDLGAAWIKVMASGGATAGMTTASAFQPQLSPSQLAAAVEQATELGVRVAAHAVGSEAIRVAVNAGVSSIEHGVGLDERTLELMLARQTWLVPTLSVYYRSAHMSEEWGRSDTVDISRQLFEEHRRRLPAAISAGARIAVGTDSIGDMVEEMQLLVACGLSPAEAVRAATIGGAELLMDPGISQGIRPGARADLVLLPSDPLQDPSVYRHPIAVIARGQEVQLGR